MEGLDIGFESFEEVEGLYTLEIQWELNEDGRILLMEQSRGKVYMVVGVSMQA